MPEFEVKPAEANTWWQNNTVAGMFLNRLMIAFIFVPIGLVFLRRYTLSFVVFAFMVPYGFLVRTLAVGAVRRFVAEHPDSLEEFDSQGVIQCGKNDHADS